MAKLELTESVKVVAVAQHSGVPQMWHAELTNSAKFVSLHSTAEALPCFMQLPY